MKSCAILITDLAEAKREVIPASVDFYTKNLGFTLAFTWGDPPTFAGMNLGKVQTFLQHGTSDPKGCTSSSAMRTNSTNFIAPTAL
jgi:hypothetical protein